jgi:hypothetical protein
METLSLNTRGWREKRASNLRRIFGRSKIIITVRHPIELTRSVYSQYIKRELILPAPGDAGRLLDINQWMLSGFRKSHSPPTCHLDYARTIQIYANQFGRKAVHVAIFEELGNNRCHFIGSLCRFLGIDVAEGLALTEQKSANLRLTGANMDALRSIAGSWYQFLRFRRATPAQRMQMIGMTENDRSGNEGKAEEHIDGALIRELEDRTRAGNRMLASEWGIPLEKYGYPL